MRITQMLPVLALALVLTSCGGAGSAASERAAAAPTAAAAAESMPAATSAPASSAASESYPPSQSMMSQDSAAGGAAPAPAPSNDVQQQAGYERLVIKTADLSLQVAQVADAEAAVRAQVARWGGYLVKIENSGTDDAMTTRIIFRVPAARFEDALSGVQGLAKKVDSRTIGGDDVTEEFVDLDSRLRNLEATRDRLLTFLDKATKVEDALSVNSSLNDIQGQIEQVKGRIQYLKQSAAFSTITVFLSPVPITPVLPEDAWQPTVVARGALRSLLELGQGLANLVIVLVVWTPLWLPLVLLALWLRRRMTRNRVAVPAPEGTTSTAV